MAKILHPMAGATALVMIATLWISTVLTEVLASHASVTVIKTAIPWASCYWSRRCGDRRFFLAKEGRAGLIDAKIKRMPFVAGNGILVLIPAALFLASNRVRLDVLCSADAQTACRATNIFLLRLNMRDGFKMKGRFRASRRDRFNAHPVV
ncbi:hypothetical protein [Bradyrhizobium sp. LMG 9283]|uniref:hypothetical protein n=1 Tax=Bradyrhizobium sp. LMG 9283 TaxID=592064 RepID=UPI003890E981